MEKVLVTGGAGFIGSFIVDELVRRGYEVRIFDNLEPQVHPGGNPPDYLNREAEFVHGDVRDYDALRKAIEGVRVIFHQAATVGVGQSMYEISRYVQVNTLGTANLCDILANQKHQVEKVLVAASMSSYGEGTYSCKECGEVSPLLRPSEQMAQGDWEVHCPHCDSILKPVPTRETKKLEVNSIYAITKRDQEDMVLGVGRVYHIPPVALRYFNVYGPRQSLSNPYTGVVAIFMSRIKNNHRPIIFEDGEQSRDFVSVHDIVQANMLAMEKEEANYQVFNVGTGRPITIKQIAQVLAELYGVDIEP
ncbi:dTDP-L-rhamnose 4-epimerase, partial [Candidatus Hakubella thermalkaliphila]